MFWHNRILRVPCPTQGARAVERSTSTASHPANTRRHRLHRFINSYMYLEYVARSRAVPLVARATSARWCRARPVSETVFSVSRRDVCSSYCLRRVTTARFPNCDCWKAKPVEIGQGTACERDDTRFFRSAPNFSRLFCCEHVCAWKLACYEQWNGVSELWKTLLGRFHKLKDFLAFDGGP